ncbi:hypothetical protein KGY14_09625 [Ameyamaea chiangmaiensis]|uniref:Transmembrane protein n=1 Tax=Ameyamaea chiangmaiensis TaxID=442969 RepID=A0A850P8X4_9PROT|nr:hypothetical protein [Ameyamaea chiangmaiensis]MBS4075448.1 hypothetical protein [Ameyamaea chiangmaiensis]NVN39020.1 hypothetical protein [Ameyamaea chiangmaiensis]
MGQQSCFLGVRQIVLFDLSIQKNSGHSGIEANGDHAQLGGKSRAAGGAFLLLSVVAASGVAAGWLGARAQNRRARIAATAIDDYEEVLKQRAQERAIFSALDAQRPSGTTRKPSPFYLSAFAFSSAVSSICSVLRMRSAGRSDGADIFESSCGRVVAAMVDDPMRGGNAPSRIGGLRPIGQIVAGLLDRLGASVSAPAKPITQSSSANPSDASQAQSGRGDARDGGYFARFTRARGYFGPFCPRARADGGV